MAKQSNPISKQCQHKSQCINDAVFGVYTWKPGATDVNLDTPVRVYCGQHKPKVTGYYRLVRIAK